MLPVPRFYIMEMSSDFLIWPNSNCVFRPSIMFLKVCRQLVYTLFSRYLLYRLNYLQFNYWSYNKAILVPEYVVEDDRKMFRHVLSAGDWNIELMPVQIKKKWLKTTHDIQMTQNICLSPCKSDKKSSFFKKTCLKDDDVLKWLPICIPFGDFTRWHTHVSRADFYSSGSASETSCTACSNACPRHSVCENSN